VQTFAKKMWKNKVKETFCCNIPVFLKESGKKMGKLSAHFGLCFFLTSKKVMRFESKRVQREEKKKKNVSCKLKSFFFCYLFITPFSCALQR